MSNDFEARPPSFREYTAEERSAAIRGQIADWVERFNRSVAIDAARAAIVEAACEHAKAVDRAEELCQQCNRATSFGPGDYLDILRLVTDACGDCAGHFMHRLRAAIDAYNALEKQ